MGTSPAYEHTFFLEEFINDLKKKKKQGNTNLPQFNFVQSAMATLLLFLLMHLATLESGRCQNGRKNCVFCLQLSVRYILVQSVPE